jgi:peptidoglycan/LPS O-acetylase OafA/YrhL
MRALAVMLVVLAHGGLHHVIPGGSGVTIFFSVSGFIITWLLLRERDATGGFAIGQFYVRRLLKIGPPLIVVLIVPSLAYAIHAHLNWHLFLAQLLFVFNWTAAGSADAGILPGTAVVWSLAIEEQFYIVFAVVWLLLARTSSCRVLLGAVAGLAIIYANSARLLITDGSTGASDRIYFGSDTRVDGLAWGILAALVLHSWLRDPEKPHRLKRFAASDWALAVAAGLYLASLAIRDPWFRDTLRFSFQSIAASIVILYGFQTGAGRIRGVYTRAVNWPWVQHIGLASYSIYLAHRPLMELYDAVVPHWPTPVDISLRVAIGVSAGLLLYRYLEVPFEAIRRSLHRETTGVSPARP